MDEDTKAPPASEQGSIVRRPVEDWATAKGHLEPTDHAKRRGSFYTHVPWQFQAAKLVEKWPEGHELTEDEYDAAIERVSK